MPDVNATPQTAELLQLLEQYRSGDSAAGDRLAEQVIVRLRQLSAQMLHGFPRLQPHTTAEDLFQGAMARFLKALRDTRIESVRHFHNLAAVQLRRELLDLARRYRQPQPAGIESAADVPAPDAIGLWIDLHEALAELDCEDRDLINDLFYIGLSQRETAALMGVSAKTVQRRWQSLCLRLYDRLGGRLPEV